MATLGQLHRLGDRGVGRHALHLEELRGTQAEQVEEIGIEANSPTADARVEISVEPCSTPQHAVYELAYPPPVARVETLGASIERGVEKIAPAQIGADLRRRDARVRHTAHAMDRYSTGWTALSFSWHTY